MTLTTSATANDDLKSINRLCRKDARHIRCANEERGVMKRTQLFGEFLSAGSVLCVLQLQILRRACK